MAEHFDRQMREAAANLDFEKAAQLRDLLADLRRTTQKTREFRRVPYTLPVALDPETDLADLGTVLGLSGPPLLIEGFDISNISGTYAVASMVRFRNGRPDRNQYRRFRIKSVEGQDDFASMAETVRRRYTRLLRESGPAEDGALGRAGAGLPDLIVIDGGKGQLGAAHGELKKLGLGSIPILGLAKEHEEIYRPGGSEPLRLGRESNALKLLQRVRDESHRFANTYNAQLRLRRISESVLDEFPGIGAQRKAALLKRFGSIQRLRRASAAEIAEVPGFGGKAAGELKAFLEARSGNASPIPAAGPADEEKPRDLEGSRGE
jgi:excinuclease ABC subunit C